MTGPGASVSRREALAGLTALGVVATTTGCAATLHAGPRPQAGRAGSTPTRVSTAAAAARPGAHTSALPPPMRPGARIPPGQVQTAVRRLDGLVADVLARSGVPGMAVAVVHAGKVRYAKGFGVRKVGAAGRVDADTVFQLASLSKSIGATVVAHEVTAGTVAWSTPVRTHLPTFELADPWVTSHLTIADLYAHRSGLPEHAGDLLEDLGYSRAQILHRLRYLPLDPFRSTYHYTNFGITAAASAVATAAGSSWEQLSEQVLYRPLRMTRTSSRFHDYARRTNRAWTHVRVDGAWRADVVRDPDAQSAAGGVSSSVNDLARWMIMLLRGGTGARGTKITIPAALTPALTPQIVSTPASVPASRAAYYGYGFDISDQPSGRVQISHSGAFNAGAGTTFMLNPLAELGIVTLTNAAPVGAAEALSQQFNDLAIYGSPQADWWTLYQGMFARTVNAPFGRYAGKPRPVHPRPAGTWRGYAGHYNNDFAGAVAVTAEPGALTLTMGPARLRYRLTHWDGNVFTYRPTGESANPGSVSAVTFTRPGHEPATAMTIEYFAQDGVGTFTR